MEAIERNPVMFSLLADAAWETSRPVDIAEWLQLYVRSRYPAGHDETAFVAWTLLNSSVYHYNGQLVKSPIDEQPRWLDLGRWQPPAYAPFDVVLALGYLLEGRESLGGGPLEQDVVDVARQVICDVWTEMLLFYQGLVAAQLWKEGTVLGKRMLELLQDLDNLLATNVNFQLLPILEEARRQGARSDEEVLNILTLWGDGRILNDYAAKEWSPMVKEYYAIRWGMWLDSITRRRVTSSSGVARIMQSIAKFEQQWYKKKKYAITPRTSKNTALELARRLVTEFTKSPSPDLYVAMEGYTIETTEHLIFIAWSRNMALAAQLCALDARCAGFTSQGLFFTASVLLVPLPPSSSSSSTVYVLKKHIQRIKVTTWRTAAEVGAEKGEGSSRLLWAAALIGLILVVYQIAQRSKSRSSISNSKEL